MIDRKTLLEEAQAEYAAGNGDIRVHGNGFIQMDLAGSRRLHVWGHPDIPRQATSTQIHDHAFSFTSEVVVGSMVDVRHSFIPQGAPIRDPDWWTHEVYRPTVREGQDTVLGPTGERGIVALRRATWHPAGSQYYMALGDLHQTYVNCPTVTVISREPRDPSYAVRVLVPRGTEPDNRFNRYQAGRAALMLILQEVLK